MTDEHGAIGESDPERDWEDLPAIDSRSDRSLEEASMTIDDDDFDADDLDGRAAAIHAVAGGALPLATRRPRRPRPPKLSLIYDDDDFVAINKPAGLSSISERWDSRAPTAVGELWKHWRRVDRDAPKPHVIHRLDKDTTGVLLFAKHRDAQAEIRRQFREREVCKTYLALVKGTPPSESGTIEIAIQPHRRNPGLMEIARRGGKSCETRWERAELFRDYTLLRLYPHQGRTHQIRISLASTGFPCAIDPGYGDETPILMSTFKRKYRTGRGAEERPLMGRLTLHAERLTLAHPTTCAVLKIEAPLAKDFAATLKQLRRWAPRR